MYKELNNRHLPGRHATTLRREPRRMTRLNIDVSFFSSHPELRSNQIFKDEGRRTTKVAGITPLRVVLKALGFWGQIYLSTSGEYIYSVAAVPHGFFPPIFSPKKRKGPSTEASRRLLENVPHIVSNVFGFE